LSYSLLIDGSALESFGFFKEVDDTYGPQSVVSALGLLTNGFVIQTYDIWAPSFTAITTGWSLSFATPTTGWSLSFTVPTTGWSAM